MQNRVLEISSNGAHLSASRGFLSVKINGEPVGQVAINDMSALIIRGHGASLSVNICSRLSEAKVPIVICGNNQSPASVIWPVSGHFSQGLNMQAQAVAKKPLRKRLWAELISHKIKAQANVLSLLDKDHTDIFAMSKRVKSGDTSNLEAQAARRYWPRVMGKNFIRDQSTPGINGALNYGYTILRAAAARSILSAGLHPSLSLHHQSRGDALRLADDLMEPFRPWVDYTVFNFINGLAEECEIELCSDFKSVLVHVLTLDLETLTGASPVQVCLHRLAQSLSQVFLGEKQGLDLPTGPAIQIEETA